MKYILYSASLLFLSSTPSMAVTPLADTVPEGVETTITCELTEAPRKSDAPVFESQKEADGAPGTYHYKVRIPEGYNADPQKTWPCLFVMSPGGGASMGAMQNYLKSRGYIVVMLVEAKNGPWAPIVGNFLASHDDVIKRFRVTEGRKYATGMSGGARGSSVFVQLRPGFCGLVLQAAGAAFGNSGNYFVKELKSNSDMRIAMTMGDADGNKGEADKMDSFFTSKRFKIFPFQGGHDWAPADVFEKAMDWVNEEKL